MSNKVIVTGSIGYDYIMNFSGAFADRIMPDKIHQLSLSFLVDSLTRQFGGTAVNFAYTFKLLGGEPLIVSCAGNDFGPYKSYLKKHKITTEYVSLHEDVTTGSYFVVTDKNNNQIGSFFVGALKYSKDLQVNVTTDAAITLIGPTDPLAMDLYVAQCQKLKLPYMYDPAFQIGNFSKKDLLSAVSGAQILIANDYEIALIEEKIGKKHDALLKLVPVVITTLGEKGSRIETEGKTITIQAASPDNTSDPTGAGDAYRAGFLAGFVRGFDLETCGQMGSVAAVYTVEKYGTQTHTFSRGQFKKRFKENFKKSLEI